MTDCAIYARVSSVEQLKGYSIEAQLESARQLAAQSGWQVVKEFIEPRSGRNDKRSEFQRMISAALAGQFQIIIVHKFDRFARNRKDAVVYKSLLREKGIQVISALQPLEPDNPNSFLLEGLTEVLDEWFLLNLRTETLKGQWRMIEQGKWPAGVPVGYYKDGGWVKVAEAGVQISLAFREFATGRYTLGSWADRAYELGITYSTGLKIPFNRWSYIFHNRFYIGVLKWAGKEALGAHQPLVDQETFDRVQDILAQHEHNVKHLHYRRYLLRGLVYSGDTNSPMTGAVGKEIRYYRSKGRLPDGRRHYIRADVLEGHLAAALQNVTLNPNDLDGLPELDETMRLAMRVAPNVGSIYQWLDSFDQRRAMVELVIARYGVHVSGQEIVELTPQPPFSFYFDSSTLYQYPTCEYTGLVLFVGAEQ